MNARIKAIAVCSLLLVAACASRQKQTGDAGPDRNVISHEQIADNHFQNAYDAVQALHPIWLDTRGTDSFSNPSRVEVYQDANHLGGVEMLRNLTAQSIEYIRWYDGTSAQQRFGIGHSGGVIYVATHKD